MTNRGYVDAITYFDKGIITIPLLGKRPVVDNWPLWEPDAYEIDSYGDLYNIGVLCGARNNIVALDFDNLPELHKKIQALIPQSPVRKKGAKGETWFFSYNGEISRKWHSQGQCVVELLSDGRQTVIPPSIHPETDRGYTWTTVETLLSYDLVDLPLLPDNIEAIIESAIFTDSPSLKASTIKSGRNNHLQQVVEAMVFKGVSDVTQMAQEIVRIDATAHEVPLFTDATEGNDPSTPPEIHARRFVVSVMASHVKNKKQNAEIPFINWGAIATTSEKPENVEVKGYKTTHLPYPPGFAGYVAKAITANATVAQPPLSISATLALLGAVKGHRVQTETGLRTNLYLLGIGSSGSGKEHPARCVMKLLKQAFLVELGIGEPGTDVGLIRGLQNSGGRGVCLWDEIGDSLGALKGKTVSSHERRIIKTLMELFSRSSDNYLGRQLASMIKGDDALPRYDIDQPCLCVYGTSTPTTFFETIGQRSILDGFLSRWLICVADDFVDRNYDVKLGFEDSIARHLVEINASIKRDQDSSSLEEYNINPTIVTFTDEARLFVKSAGERYEAKRREEIRKQSGIESLYARALEHVMKVALVIEDKKQIGVMSLEWAKNFVDASIDDMLLCMSEEVQDTGPNALKLDKIETIIKSGGTLGISRRDILRKSKLLIKEVDPLLDQLEQSGVITIVVDGGAAKWLHASNVID